ncbi:T0103520 isoform 1 [Pongo abelii]|uniref:T0103520 isoform 1 n=1 Tax=Pongo abelii TaxID=9601 RepID=A0A2J8U8R0_PONAB|nr:T0103520 isoform 1 [Pongo abelii]
MSTSPRPWSPGSRSARPWSNSSLSLQGKSGPMTGVVLVAVGEVAMKILLLCLCVILLRVRSCRRKAARAAPGMEAADAVTD